jgi:hypothetical protein
MARRNHDVGFGAPTRQRGLEKRKTLSRCPQGGALGHEAGRAPSGCKLGQPALPLTAHGLLIGEAVVKQKCVVHLFGVAGIGPGLAPHAFDRRVVQGAEVGRLGGIEPPSRHDSLRSTFFEGGIV